MFFRKKQERIKKKFVLELECIAPFCHITTYFKRGYLFELISLNDYDFILKDKITNQIFVIPSSYHSYFKNKI